MEISTLVYGPPVVGNRYQGRRELGSADSDVDDVSVYREQSICFGSDDFAQSSDDDFQQKISSLEAQLARLKTSIEN